jgi:L-asparaginase II
MNHWSAETDAIVEPVRRIEKENAICGTASLKHVGFLKGVVDGGADSAFDLDARVSTADFEF